MNSEELISLIKRYESLVEKGNRDLKTFYKIDICPLLAKNRAEIPKSGKIVHSGMSFRFHGMGCRFEFGKLVVEFNYTYFDFIYKGFETSKLYWFIESCLKDQDGFLSRAEFDKAILKLESEDVLKRKDKDSIDNYDFVLLKTG